ncbi:tyrosine-type recombinase/integrase [Leyella stercorea]|jgi:integrase|uniref:tyrosine-type recombinase/integrase n=1 Tax=Leyella stercorea TaxID=363265 RepID=UPI002431E65C|nr:phage integrase SAM-like domain-containing protein [Leyella stercorea]
MKYFISTKESKRNENGLIPVSVIFRDNRKEFTVSTGIMAKYPVNGVSFAQNEPNSKAKTKRLVRIIDSIDKFILEHEDMGYELQKEGLRAIVTGKESKSKLTLSDYIRKCAAQKKESTKKGYLQAAAIVEEFDNKAILASVDKSWLDKLARHMDERAASVNYKALILYRIRSVFNWALDNELTNNYPFRRYKIKTEKTPINNISVEQLRAIRDYPLNNRRAMYRDLFMLTFYLCGINPADLLTLKDENLQNGRIRYRRRKTGKLYNIPAPPEAMEIIRRYKGRNWLLSPLDKNASYLSYYRNWYAGLKKIGTREVVKRTHGPGRPSARYKPIVDNLTVYTARYTFASIGAELEIPRETIALCLGHSWADVTDHYIAYGTKRIDDAVRKIIDYVNGDKA